MRPILRDMPILPGIALVLALCAAAIAIDHYQAIGAWLLSPMAFYVWAGLGVVILLTVCVVLAIAYMPLDPDKLGHRPECCAPADLPPTDKESV